MVRMKEFDPAEVRELAVQAFKRHGYHAAALDTLTDEMGIGRASLYATYGDKRALFRARSAATPTASSRASSRQAARRRRLGGARIGVTLTPQLEAKEVAP